jgi:hypothetical protein
MTYGVDPRIAEQLEREELEIREAQANAQPEPVQEPAQPEPLRTGLEHQQSDKDSIAAKIKAVMDDFVSQLKGRI